MQSVLFRRPLRATRAFTLIEVLVVVAIIALPISILLPSLKMARENARATICGTNGHQMGLALQMYMNVYRYTTAHHLVNNSVTTTEWVMFPVRLLRSISSSGKKYNQQQIFWCPNAVSIEKWDGVKRITPWKTGSQKDFPTFDYGINDWGSLNVSDPCQGMGGHVYNPTYKDQPAQGPQFGERPVEKLKRPAHFLAFADNNINQAGQYDWDTALDPNSPSEWPGNRHSNLRCMVVFADGHALLMQQKKLTDMNNDGIRRMWNNDDKPHR